MRLCFIGRSLYLYSLNDDTQRIPEINISSRRHNYRLYVYVNRESVCVKLQPFLSLQFFNLSLAKKKCDIFFKQ